MEDDRFQLSGLLHLGRHPVALVVLIDHDGFIQLLFLFLEDLLKELLDGLEAGSIDGHLFEMFDLLHHGDDHGGASLKHELQDLSFER